jgi:hypothetical protein
MFRQDGPQGAPTVFFTHNRVQVGRGFMFRMGLQIPPVHEEAIGQAAEHAHEADAARISDPATVVVIGHIQPLVQTIFDSPVDLMPFGYSRGGAKDRKREWTFVGLRFQHARPLTHGLAYLAFTAS